MWLEEPPIITERTYSWMGKKIETDNVNHPAHYNTGTIEVINYIKDKLTC